MMVCPLGRVKTSDQPLTARGAGVGDGDVLGQAGVPGVDRSATRHAPEPAAAWSAAGRGGGVVGGGLGVVGRRGGVAGGRGPPVRPKNAMAYAAMPLDGRLCPAPWMLYASTCDRAGGVGVAAAVPAGLRRVGGRRGLAQPEHVGPLLDLLLQQRVRHEGVGGAVPQLHPRAGAGVAGVRLRGPRRPTAAGSGSCCRRCTGCCRAGSRRRWRSSRTARP